MVKKSIPARRIETYSIVCKFSDKVLIPSNGIQDSFYKRSPDVDVRLRTTDNFLCQVKFLTTWHNEDGRYDKELDDVCMSIWSIPFSSFRSVWIGRLGKVDDYWNLIELIKV